MANKKKYIGFFAAVVLLVTVFTGCEINIGKFEDDLVLDSGYAWVTEGVNFDFDFWDWELNINYEHYGLQFKDNGKVYVLEENWGGHWKIVDSLPYSIHGNNIKIDGKSRPYNLDHDDLTIGGDYFEKEYVGNVKW